MPDRVQNRSYTVTLGATREGVILRSSNMMQCANNADKQSTVSGVASVDPGMCRVESVRDSLQSTSLRALGRESSRGARQSTQRVGPRSESYRCRLNTHLD